MTIYDKCLEHQIHYQEIYGDKTIVFIQVGDFYEAYCTEEEGYPLKELTPIIDIHWTRKNEKDKNGKTRPISRSSPIMLGFPISSANKFMKKLADSGFTVVLFDQVDLPGVKHKGHELLGVYTPGFFDIDPHREECNYIFSIYVSEEKQLHGSYLICLGISMIDITTGHSIVHESYGKYHDENYALDELNRIFLGYNPKDIVIYFNTDHNLDVLINKFSNYVNLKKYRHRIITLEDKLQLIKKDFFKLTYQNTYLNNVFNISKRLTTGGNESIIEKLGLERKIFGIISYMILLEFVREHNEKLITNLRFPDIYCRDRHLMLGNDAIQQLNVVSNHHLETINKQFESLFDVVNETVTPMGKRFLHESLINPFSGEMKDEIKKRYNDIGTIGKDYEKILKALRGVRDTERAHRKMLTGRLTVNEFLLLHDSYENLKTVIFHVRKNTGIKEIVERYHFIDEWNKMIEEYSKLFNLEKMKNVKPHTPTDSFYRGGNHKDIDKLQAEVTIGQNIAVKVKDKISKIIEKEIKINFKKKDGYYCNIPRSKSDLLKATLKKGITITSDEISIEISGDKFTFRELGGYDQVYIELPKEKSDSEITIKREILSKTVMKYYREDISIMYSKYSSCLSSLDQFVAYFDFILSGAKIADIYEYCRPKIVSNDGSFIDTISLRHPVIERINIETAYVPHDIKLGNVDKKNGILIYGLNSAGKSSLMKAIGLSVILAQMGYYVPAKSFKYNPYMGLYARITGNDNIFKRMSSFGVEMSELNAIIRRVSLDGNDTLVIGDEICRGTEQTSGIAIVTAAIKKLSQSGSSFVLASHLHQIVDQKEFKQLDNVRVKHIRVDYDSESSKLIFRRLLEDGEGPKDYGIAVAKHFIQDKEFMTEALSIKNRLLGGLESVSKYNSKLPKIKCELCGYLPKERGKELETHHLHQQSECRKDGKMIGKEHIHKNHLSNLVILCRPCHMFFHNCSPQIKEIIETSNGRDIVIDITKKKKLSIF